MIFGRHDLILDPPISRLTLLVCRNTLMYFNHEVQQRILERFRFGLSEGGFLFLGKAEMLLTRSKSFIPVDLTKRVFAKASRTIPLDGETAIVARGTDPKDMIMLDRLRELSFQSDASGQIVIDRARTLIMINERVRTLFGLTADDIGKPLGDLEISYRPVELRSILEQAWTEHRPVNAKDVEWTSATGERVYLDVQVMPLVDASLETIGATIIFRDTTPEAAARGRAEALAPGARNHQRRAAVDQRRARDDQRGAAVDGRGARDDERRAAVDERRARDDERGAAVDERRAADDQRAASTERRRAQSGERVRRKHPQQLPRRLDRRRRRAAGSGVEPSIGGFVGTAHRGSASAST